jgi:hypothetical protein
MHCLDCHKARDERVALGICHQCGAAVCATHATMQERPLTCTKPVYRTVAVDPPVRRLLCGACAAAHQAYAACCPQPAGVAST